MASLRAGVLRFVIRVVVRRRHWGDGVKLVKRARRLFGLMKWFQLPNGKGVELRKWQASGFSGDDLGPLDSPTVLLYLHGGGYLGCSPATHRPITRTLAKLIPTRVIALDYRLAPEHPFPAAVDDAVAAYRWILDQGYAPEQIRVAGDSAGGGLTLALMLKLKELQLPHPTKLFLMSPWTDLTGSCESIYTNDGKCTMFRADNLDGFASHYCTEKQRSHPLVSPLFADLTDLPPMLIQVDSSEVLFDDSRVLHENAVAAGVDSTIEIHDGLLHVWQIYVGVIPEAKTSLHKAAAFLAN
jgi:epsilon-lactone hydrolase